MFRFKKKKKAIPHGYDTQPSGYNILQCRPLESKIRTGTEDSMSIKVRTKSLVVMSWPKAEGGNDSLDLFNHGFRSKSPITTEIG